jgi:hypothetical protein
MTPQTQGLRSRIEKAQSVKELNALLAEGGTYEFASNGTKSRWQKAAQFRAKQLETEEAPVPAKKKAAPKKAKKAVAV